MPELRRGVRTGRYSRRIALAFVVTAIAAAALTAILVNLAIDTRFDAYLQSQQQAREQQVVAVLAAEYRRVGQWRRESLDELAPTLVMSGATVEVLDRSGNRVWTSSTAAMSPDMSAMHREMMGIPSPAPPSRLSIMVDGEQVGTAVVRVPQATLPAADREFRDSVNWLLLGGAVVAGVLALLVGLALTRRTTVQVGELTAAANERAAGRRDRRAMVSSKDEIGELAESFNTMADAVTREDELRVAFASDVAHELRTPLAILQSQVEAIRDGVSEPDSGAFESLHEETLRLGSLVADLETLADAGAAEFTLHRREVALRPLVEGVLDSVANQIATNELELVTDLGEVTANVDEVRLRQVLDNLVSNALKFTPSGGRITVTLDQRDRHTELIVADDGPGIPPEELQRVFERFFRGAGSAAAGSGVGLAVAAELVAAHGGEISVESVPGHGSRFLVRLPGRDYNEE
jgi:two-component system sensor histidine kinase BaeS